MRVRLSARAVRDAESIRAHVANDRPLAASRLFTRLMAACNSLADFPHMAQQGRRPEVRELKTVWPYVIVYRVQTDTVRIDRIFHGAQRR